MDLVYIVVFVICGIIGIPSVAYMTMKFGAAGYFRAKRRDEEKHGKDVD